MPRQRNTPERLWSLVERRGQDECWPWRGWRNTGGYGRFELDGKSYYAHRAIFALANPGIISVEAPKDRQSPEFLRHKCDNPSCCNPNHLEVGTHLQNMQDKVVRGRSKWFDLSTESPRAKLSVNDVKNIRKLSKEGVTRKELSQHYNVSIQTIKAVRSGRHYSDIS